MSKCDISIEFDRSDRLYRIGDTVRCRIKVEVNKPVVCEGLTLLFLWRTHGRGNRDEGRIESITLFRGNWEHDTYFYDASFLIPPGPITHHGPLVNVDYYVSARADIPWAIDPRAEEDLVVTRGADPRESAPLRTEPEFGGTSAQPISANNSGSAVGWILAVVAAIPLLISCGFFAAAYFNDEPSFLIFGGAIFFVFCTVAWAFLRNRIASRKFSALEFAIDKVQVLPGENIEATLRFVPKAGTVINRATVTLQGTERATSGSGTNTRTYRETFHSEELAIDLPPTTHPGFETRKTVTLRLPENAAPSFESGDNAVSWSVTAALDIDRWPDWSSSTDIWVC